MLLLMATSKFRSGLEERVATYLESRGIKVEYEVDKIVYEIPARQGSYCPDFLLPDGSYLETKGWFKVQDRAKHLNIKKSRPDVHIRFAFQNPHTPIYQGSQTTYASWCDHHNFSWCDAKQIPEHWLFPPANDNQKSEAITGEETNGNEQGEKSETTSGTGQED